MKIEQKPSTTSTSNTSNLLDFGETPKTQTVPVNDFQTNVFQTNTFQTKNGNGFDDFLQSFKQNETNLLDDEDQFATNAYVNRNYYLDLQASKQQQSEKYFSDGMIFAPTE